MNTRTLWAAGGAAALGLALIALPARSASSQNVTQQNPNDAVISRLQHKIEELQARLQAQLDSREEQRMAIDGSVVIEDLEGPDVLVTQEPGTPEALPKVKGDDFSIFVGDDGASWLGVETQEVTTDKAKELKLSAERGVVVEKVLPDSPAAKAGLKENDVVTEINGQRIEGAAQFRRMIHEIPAGRSVQLTVWRDGRSQTINATLGKAEERVRQSFKLANPTPGAFAFRMPEIPDIPPMEWNGFTMLSGQPKLGIDAEEISGQLGTFFGAPDGEGILVREVNAGSSAEKAGVKAGDVITSLNGERIRTLGELREKLSAKRDDKDRKVKLGVLRNHSEISLTVELPEPTAKMKHTVSHRTNI